MGLAASPRRPPHTVRSPRAAAALPTANLPPTLAKSQVSSVRKNLKLHLLSVLKHPASLEFQAQITTLLVDLGTPQAEIARNMPSSRDARKRPRDDSDSALKKMKLGELWAGPAGGVGAEHLPCSPCCGAVCLLLRMGGLFEEPWFPLGRG